MWDVVINPYGPAAGIVVNPEWAATASDKAIGKLVRSCIQEFRMHSAIEFCNYLRQWPTDELRTKYHGRPWLWNLPFSKIDDRDEVIDSWIKTIAEFEGKDDHIDETLKMLRTYWEWWHNSKSNPANKRKSKT